ncbi:MAG: Secretion protein HlyD family protein [Candidatus Falkowbacteria bacterium GW2011_GWC2_38_22]|uniref:Secretion protein HlyD family protein n=1 Tax=Candidatus Falkowbacteria bacterium GW2011_GWE1_38_31 TaxID=1618638 RepID=A0A0G0MB72_9BACT|nr:MAG: Secretion protein HlyD family protein [Candidatus Falkowbacteria bacterium GW2011_GWF2_38_1205]KKQ62159.1 MAG: Secretion protein HlyD family protein [Candidatus Falkowbacteria bacterium GW2011_GWC2_38_22]KKQ64309.1 MAG: Secretion protein HlyD family protein [Candidatus Falkowbacteria bacterium GW2011_GWF1_38_22]KKQ66286.1 MAG: Secretion protein HlyD family protein [Candidatus Falkowbacteria bacterium GW2011_GWE2_38_254]KKQ71014.1 MAG: Secretion protein HlyD family protein [Candidatus Fa
MSESIIEASRKARKNGIFGFFKRKSVIIPLILIVIALGVWFFYNKNQSTKETKSVVKISEATVKKSDLQIAIEADGKVVSEDGVELSFSVSGDTLEVNQVFVKEGDKIKKGDKIASVRTDDLNYDLNKAYSNYQSVLASYNEKVAGATDKEIANAKSSIEQAEISLSQAKISLEKTRNSANEKIEDAEENVNDTREDMELNKNEATSKDIKNAYADILDTVKAINLSFETILLASDKIIGVDDTDINDSFEVNLGAKDNAAYLSAKDTYLQAKYSYDELNDSVIGLSKTSTYSEIDDAVKKAEKALTQFEAHLYQMQKMINATISTASLSQTQIDTFKSTISSNRSTINAKITALNNNLDSLADARENLDDYITAYNNAVKDLATAKEEAKQDIANSEASLAAKELSLQNAKNDYTELLKPLSDSELASARSSLTTASINLDKARNDLNKAVLTSPIDGELALLNYKAGDIILSNESKPVAVIINNDTLFVELNIEESDISKLSVGQKAVATFDALDEQEFNGELIYISQTAETSNNGIVTYLVKAALSDTKDSKIREGMTASVNFIIDGVADVLQIPVSAVRNVNSKPSVQLKSNEWVEVSTGFTDGKNVEIKSGLNVGDIVLY